MDAGGGCRRVGRMKLEKVRWKKLEEAGRG